MATRDDATLKLHVAPLSNDKPLRVLCATDLWARSDHAVQRALRLADRHDAKLMLLHVVDGQTPPRIAGRRADHAHSALRWRLRGRRGPARPPSISVRIGNPHKVIAQTAQKWRADIIVLGAYRPRPWDAVLGTTAERLVRRARQAVLIVNASVQGDYSNVAVVESGEGGARLIQRAVSLGLVDSNSLVRNPDAAPTDLLVAAAPDNPTPRRLLGTNPVSRLARSVASDLLILSPRGVQDPLPASG